MKKLVSLLLVIGLLLTLMVPQTIQAASSGNFVYNVSNGEATVTEYTGNEKEVTIPQQLGGYPVTSIGSYAFSSCYSIEHVTIPNSVMVIGDFAFSSCYSLAQITIPSSVTVIGDGAFYKCYALTTAIISSGVTVIGDNAFYDCAKLASVILPQSVITIGDGAFGGDCGLQTAYYIGTENQWSQTAVKSGNTALLNSLVFVNVEINPFGDANLDGLVNATDALEILKAVVGKTTLEPVPSFTSDVDGNGKADAADALLVLKKVVGKIETFPTEKDLGYTPSTEIEPFKISLGSIRAANYTSDDANGKAFSNALSSMKKKGIETQINTLDANYATDTIVKEVMAGNSSADIYEVSLINCRNIAKLKASANLYDSTTLNKSLFNCAATESVTFNGRAYGVTWASKSVNPMGVIYNKDLIGKYSSSDIANLYDAKKWNFDTFQAIAKACTVDTDGNRKTDIYGFTSNTNVIGMALTSNAGGMALKVNERVEATMCSEAGIKTLEWCKEMFKTDKSWLYKADINQCITEFNNGKAAMFVSYLHYYHQITPYANFNIGFVPMPMGPNQTTYRNGVYDGDYYIVPKTKADRLDDIGHWLNEMAKGTGAALLNNNVKDLAENGFDAHSQEVYKWVVNNMTPDYSSGVFTSTISSSVDNSVTSPARVPAKVVASIKTQAQKECDDYYADIYTYSGS